MLIDVDVDIPTVQQAYLLNFCCVFSVSGGVGNNDFIMELISSMTGCVVHRLEDPDTTLLGAVYLAGLGAGDFLYTFHSFRLLEIEFQFAIFM